MINFDPDDKEVQEYALYYARKVDSQLAIEMYEGKRSVTSKEEATEFSIAYWEMNNLMVDDLNEDALIKEIEHIDQYQSRIDLFHYTGGYLFKSGYEQQWNEVKSQYL